MLSVVREKTLESPLDRNKIKLFNPKGNQRWIFIGRTDAEAEAPILLPPDGKSRLIGKDPNAREDWGQEEKGMTEVEMVGWHPWLKGHEVEQSPGDNEGQGSLVCSSFIPELPDFPLVSFFLIISCRAGLLLTSSLNFLSSENVFCSQFWMSFLLIGSLSWLLLSRHCSSVFWPLYFWWEIC